MTKASAPGKIVLCGEYAVLSGAPAICMAVDRRARVEVENSEHAYHTVDTIGPVDGEWRFKLTDGGRIDWICAEAPAGSLDLLLEVLVAGRSHPVFDFKLDTREFFDSDSGQKLGLGSSAALTAALLTALTHATGDSGAATAEAQAAHRRFQKGRGSGVDIAASLYGGIIEYRTRDSGGVNALRWPAGLEYAVLWSGRPASTGDKLDLLETGPEPNALRLCAAAEAVLEAWEAGKAADLLPELRRYVETLGQFDIDHGLGIFDAGHRELADAVEDSNLIYKPCGAGGGDIGIIFGIDRKAVAGFTEQAQARGFQTLHIAVDPRGAIIES